jgi:hypothetical protein
MLNSRIALIIIESGIPALRGLFSGKRALIRKQRWKDRYWNAGEQGTNHFPTQGVQLQDRQPEATQLRYMQANAALARTKPQRVQPNFLIYYSAHVITLHAYNLLSA